jgi:hypothetical protein
MPRKEEKISMTCNNAINYDLSLSWLEFLFLEASANLFRLFDGFVRGINFVLIQFKVKAMNNWKTCVRSSLNFKWSVFCKNWLKFFWKHFIEILSFLCTKKSSPDSLTWWIADNYVENFLSSACCLDTTKASAPL